MTEETTEVPVDTTEPTKRLKESDWIVITALWERGEATLAELSDRFGVSKAALSQGLKRRKAVRGSKAHMATKRIQDKIDSEKDKLVEDIYNFKKRFIGYGDYLSRKAIETIQEAEKPGGVGIANTRGDLLAINEATKIVSKVRDDLYYLYDLYDDKNDHSEVFDFNVGVYSEKDIDEMRAAQKVLDELDESEAEMREPDEDEILDDDTDYGEEYEGV